MEESKSSNQASSPYDAINLLAARDRQRVLAGHHHKRELEQLCSVFIIEKSRRGSRAMAFLKRFMDGPETILLSRDCVRGKVVPHPHNRVNFDLKQEQLPDRALNPIGDPNKSADHALALAAGAAITHLQSFKGLKWFFVAGTHVNKLEIEGLWDAFPNYYIINLPND